MNFLWLALALDLEKILGLDRHIDSKTNWFLEYIKRLYEQVFFVMQFKNLCITDRLNIKKCRKILEFLLLIIFQLFVFKVYCFGIKVSTYNRFLLYFPFINKIFTVQQLKSLKSYECKRLVLDVEAVIYLLLHNLHDCTFKPRIYIIYYITYY